MVGGPDCTADYVKAVQANHFRLDSALVLASPRDYRISLERIRGRHVAKEV